MADHVSDQLQEAQRNDLRKEVGQLEDLVMQHLDDFSQLVGIVRDIVHACGQMLQVTDQLHQENEQQRQEVKQLKQTRPNQQHIVRL